MNLRNGLISSLLVSSSLFANPTSWSEVELTDVDGSKYTVKMKVSDLNELRGKQNDTESIVSLSMPCLSCTKAQKSKVIATKVEIKK